jgi:hypothetical protein
MKLKVIDALMATSLSGIAFAQSSVSINGKLDNRLRTSITKGQPQFQARLRRAMDELVGAPGHGRYARRQQGAVPTGERVQPEQRENQPGRRCVHMAYVQLSLLGIPAVVVHGNALSLDVWGVWYTPAHVLVGWGSYYAIDCLIIRICKSGKSGGKRESRNY